MSLKANCSLHHCHPWAETGKHIFQKSQIMIIIQSLRDEILPKAVRDEEKSNTKIGKRLLSGRRRERKMLHNNCDPSSHLYWWRACSSCLSMLAFICILNTISQTFIVLRMRKTIENMNQEEAFLCVSTRSDSIHIHPRILLLFFVVSSTRSLVVFLRLIERCFDKRLRRKKKRRAESNSPLVGRQISDSIVCCGDFSSRRGKSEMEEEIHCTKPQKKRREGAS